MQRMDIHKEIKKLENIRLEKPERVFTMYLNTDPADPDQQGNKWKISLKNGLNRFESYLKNDKDKEELKNFIKIQKKVQSFMNENELNLAKSVVIFATPDDSTWFAEILQVRVKTDMYWEELAVVEQLLNLVHDYPKAGIILTQKEEIKVIGTEFGRKVGIEQYEFDLDTEGWKRRTGPHNANPGAGSGGKSVNRRELYNKRFEANRHRWYKNIAGNLDKFAKDKGWTKIYMIGNQDETRDLSNAMSKPIDVFINKNMLDKNEDSVIKAILDHKE